jgi:Ca-activated chloride channel family protein
MSGRAFAREIPVDLPENESQHDVLASLWARARIDDLMSQDYAGIQNNSPRDDIRELITQLGLDFRLMTQFTSFVAVEEMTITDGGEPRKIEVPVEMPEGVSHKGVFGERDQPFDRLQRTAQTSVIQVQAAEIVSVSPRAEPRSKKDSAAGHAGGMGKGSGGGTGSGRGGGMGPGNGKGVGPGRGYNMGGGSPSLGGGDRAKPLTPEEQKRRDLLAKLNPSVAAIIDRLKNKNTQPGPDEARFVRNGKAEIQVWLADKSAETVAQLKQLGFEIVLEPKTTKMIIGRLPIEKLAALAELKSVRYIAPMLGN